MSDEYSIWLVPDTSKAAFQKLEELISHYAEIYEVGPEFTPHITVVGGVTGDKQMLTNQVHALADAYEPFEVSFSTVQCSTTRHQCVFLLVEPTLELFSLHQAAVEALELREEIYVPHLSIIYSDMSVEQRIDIVDSFDTSSVPDTTQITTLALVKTTGPTSEWETLTTVQM